MFENFIKMTNKNSNLFFLFGFSFNLIPAVKITSKSCEIPWSVAHSALNVNGPNLTCGPILNGHGLNPNIK